jgi:hypothetical protein
MTDRNFVWLCALLYLAVALFPTLFGYGAAGERFYTGFEVNPDDMCVYSAWMEQARRGHLLFDNRFTTEEQPRLTIHLLFLALGNVSRVTRLPHPVVFHLARGLFGLLFIFAAWRLICRLAKERFARRLTLGVLLVSAGVGWAFTGMEAHAGPTDLWQPEGFVFPSLMTNALFAASLWLLVEVWLALLDARDGWRPVVRGILAMLVLGNIHTYDVLTVALVAAAMLPAAVAIGAFTWPWAARAALIGLGAVPPVAWLWYVRRADPVFAARAATLTFSPDMWQFVVGYAPLLVLAAAWLWLELHGRVRRAAWRAATWLPPAVLALLCFLPGWLNRLPEGFTADSGLLTGAGRLAVFLAVFIVLALGAFAICRHLRATEHYRPTYALAVAWACVALWLPFFPALFQRKLTMGAHLPLAVLAGLGLAAILARFGRPGRESRLAAFAVLAALSISNLLWIQRSLIYIDANQGSTGIHRVFLTSEQGAMLAWMRDNLHEEASVLDLTWYACYIPALAGQRTFAAHWSETPDFARNFQLVNRELYDIHGFGGTSLSEQERFALVRDLGLEYVVWYKAEEGDEHPMTDFSGIGDIVFDSRTLALVKVR